MTKTVLSRHDRFMWEGVMQLLNPDYLNAIAQLMLAGAALITAIRRRAPPSE